MLFTPGHIGTLALPNRLIRSATAERMADNEGRPRPQLKTLYEELASGGVGLIITGHMYVHPSGRAHPEMTGIHDDKLIPALAELAEAVHRAGGLVVAQINHGGVQCSREVVAEAIAPSAVNLPHRELSAREMTSQEIAMLIEAYAQAARRAKAAGFDGVQLHGAHGYLFSQFLSPFINHRTDEWGGELVGRMRFLREVCRAVRQAVGADYPFFIKLGMMDGVEGGLTLEEGAQVVAALAEMGLDGVELSGGVGGTDVTGTVRTEADEGYFRPLARRARLETKLPIALVGGFRSRKVMEEVLATGEVDFISLCRPLIHQPDFPKRLRTGELERSSCISGNRCWPDGPGEGIACKCRIKSSSAKGESDGL